MPTSHSTRVILFVCLGLIGLVLTAHAQADSIPIQYGETLTGTITESVSCQYYRFEGTQGDPITLDMTRISGSLDGVMALYWQDDFTQAPLINNDDRPGGGLDPLIEFTLPETTWYTVAACRLQADQMRVTTGDYSLTLIGPGGAAVPETAPTSPPGGDDSAAPNLPNLSDSIFGDNATPAEDAGGLSSLGGGSSGDVQAITAETFIEGELAADAVSVSYQLDVAAGDSVVIAWQRTDGDLAPQLQIADATGRVLALAATPDAVSTLTLGLVVPGDGPLMITVMRNGATVENPALDGSAGMFVLAVSVNPTTGAN